MGFLEQDIFVDEFTCLNIAKGLSPFDTGNLRYNAIKSFAIPDGFGIKYSLQDAYYIRLLEEGISTMKHFGFIANKTVPAIASYLYAKYQSKDQNRLAKFYALEQGLLESDLSDVDIVSRYNRESRSARHDLSLGMNLEDAYENIEDVGSAYQRYNPQFPVMEVSYRGRGL